MNLLQAIELQQGGQLQAAEDACREILLTDPENAEAWHLLGLIAHQSGQSEVAVEWIEQALQLAPGKSGFWNHLGDAFGGLGQLEKAAGSYRQALSLEPELVAALVSLAAILGTEGKELEAIALFRKALALAPEYAEGHLQYGLVQQAREQTGEAIKSFQRACALNASSVEAHYHLGVALETSERFPEALASYEKAARLAPLVGEVSSRWGLLLLRLGQARKAEEVLRKPLQVEPANPQYQANLGYALQACGKPADALELFRSSVQSSAGDPEVHNQMGIAFKDLGDFREAAQCFHRALGLKPEMLSALNNLGNVCNELGLTTEALACFEILISRKPDSAGAHNNIGKILKDRGDAEGALKSYQRALALNPNNPATQDNRLLCLQYLAEKDPANVFRQHQLWGQALTQKSRGKHPHKTRNRDPERKLRVGYVSPDFCRHPVAVFIEPLLALHDRRGFEVYCYSDVKSPDAVTERLKTLADVWKETAALDARALSELIYRDQIDLLVDLCGHTAGNRLETFALQPAPCQVTYLGYPGTTGLAAIGYRLTDQFADPVGMTEAFHTEKLVRIESCAWCFRPPDQSPEIPLREDKGFITFGCFNQMGKLNPELFTLWAKILERVPGSHLKLKARSLLDETVKRDLIGFFEARGIEESRLELSGFAPTVRAHLEEYLQVDIALDSFPYHGTTTTCEALWMGVPVISLAGRTHVSRVSVSLLNAVGLPELVASTSDDYVAKAAQLANDPERLAQLRSGLRMRMQSSPLMNPARFASAVERALRTIWRQL